MLLGGLDPAYFHNQSNVVGPVVTISASGANAGFTRLYHEDIWASDCSYISREQSQTPYLWYVFLKINQDRIYFMQQGAAQPHIYPSDLMRLKISSPSHNEIWDYMETFLSPFFQKIAISQKESKILSNLRDTLLPKLISGEIKVPTGDEA